MREDGDRVSAAERSIIALDTAASRAHAANYEQLAAFCTAAGQAYSLGRNGNPYQARTFLLDGLRFARKAQAWGIGGLAAYRLGAVGSSSTTALTRGLKRSVALSPTGSSVALASNDPCAMLLALDPDNQGPALITVTALTCAIDQGKASGQPVLSTLASLRLARFWLSYGRYTVDREAVAKENARKVVAEILPVAEHIADPSLRTLLMGRLFEMALDAGTAPDSAMQKAVATMRASAGADFAMQAVALAAHGRLELVRGDKATASSLFRQAIFLETQGTLPVRLADWHLLLAEADPAARQANIAAARRALDQIRPLLGPYDEVTEDSNFALRLRPVFEALVDHGLSKDKGDDPATIADAQAIVEQYRQAELQSVFGSACVTTRVPLVPADLKAGEVLLYPILLPDRIELLYASGDGTSGARYHRLPANLSANRATAMSLVSQVLDSTSIGGDDLWRAPARKLYDLLIAPIAQQLPEGSTLVIVPDGPLSALPFGAMVDPSGHFLIERTRVSVIPSLAYSQPGSVDPIRNPRVVAAVLEKQVDLPYGSYDKLESAGKEALEAVGGDGAAASRNLLIRNFKRADLVRALEDRKVDVLHLATHANFNGRSDRSYIVADGELIQISDLRAIIAQNQTRGEQLDLLVLSACETAVGDDEASMGLAGTAVQAGARSAIASLWQVNDVATGDLMKVFYERYRATGSKAGSLRDAQLSMIARTDGSAEPNLWAAFTLLGAWR